MNKSIRPHNNKCQRHGYWEVYWQNGNLWFKAHYINDVAFGYRVSNNTQGTVFRETYYAK
jgi:hypothetical protein